MNLYPDLVPTMAFQEAVHLLKIILNTHDVSVVPDVSPLSSMTEVSAPISCY